MLGIFFPDFITIKLYLQSRTFLSQQFMPSISLYRLYLFLSNVHCLPQHLQLVLVPLREKCPNTELFLVRIFPHSENGGKYGPEITLYLDTFHALRLDAQSLRYHSNVRLKTCYLTLLEFFFRKTLKGKHCFALEAHLNLSKYYQLFYKLRNS